MTVHAFTKLQMYDFESSHYPILVALAKESILCVGTATRVASIVESSIAK